MNMKEYKEKHKMTYREMGKKFGVSYTTCQSWVVGTKHPKRLKALEIIEITGGQVTMIELME